MAEVILVEASSTHIWKLLLHEVAAAHEDEMEYLAQTACNHFRYRRGRMDTLDRRSRAISVTPTYNEKGRNYPSTQL
jgi:NADH dehydrogenase